MPAHFVDFRIVKDRVSIEQVLEHYNIRLRRTNQNALRGFCPLPTHSSEKSRESFGVDLVQKIWACQSTSCASAREGKKGGNILDLVAAMESCTVRDAALRLSDLFLSSDTRTSKNLNTQELENSKQAKSGRKVNVQNSDNAKLVAEKSGEVPTSNKPLSFSLTGIDAHHAYIASRGITTDTADFFGIGFFPGRGSMSGRVVIPIHNERGELLAYAGRAIDDTEPKYKLPSGFKKSDVLFNLQRVRENPNTQNFIILVEGFFDCVNVHQAGFQNVVALMGSTMSDAQKTFLMTFDRVVLLLDGDEAGERGAREIAAELVNSTFVKVLHLERGEQPDQLSTDQIQAVLAKV